MDEFDRPTMFLLSESCSSESRIMTLKQFAELSSMDMSSAKPFYDNIPMHAKRSEYTHAATIAYESLLWREQSKKHFVSRPKVPVRVAFRPELERRIHGDEF